MSVWGLDQLDLQLLFTYRCAGLTGWHYKCDRDNNVVKPETIGSFVPHRNTLKLQSRLFTKILGWALVPRLVVFVAW